LTKILASKVGDDEEYDDDDGVNDVVPVIS
jgi:hypothetical protein